jgi:tetratricopeptide (TPR) repeat protein
VVRTPAGVAVTARVDAAAGKRLEGAEADLDKLVGQEAEAVYAETQPYRWAVYLASHGRSDEALTTYRQLTRSGPAEERAWAYTGWATLATLESHRVEAERLAEEAIRLNPMLYPPYAIRGNAQDELGWKEAELSSARRELALQRGAQLVGLSKAAAATRQQFLKALEASLVGDYVTTVALVRSQAGAAVDFEGRAGAYDPVVFLGAVLALDHDISGSRRAMTGVRSPGGSIYMQPMELEDWAWIATNLVPLTRNPALGDIQATAVPSQEAVVYAHLGRFAEAETLLAQSSPDCDDCLVARGQVAGLRHDWAMADRWFGEAEKHAPSIPFADTEWAKALLDKGDPDRAITKAAEAQRRGPHYADPIELWGEALMRKGDLEGAIAKFAEADQYAPRWGRDHLRWGEALMLSGRYREARAQYEAANGMDLSRPDRAALNVLLARTAGGPLHG